MAQLGALPVWATGEHDRNLSAAPADNLHVQHRQRGEDPPCSTSAARSQGTSGLGHNAPVGNAVGNSAKGLRPKPWSQTTADLAKRWSG